MTKRMGFFAVSIFSIFCVLILVPVAAPAQDPDPEQIAVREVNEFYRGYWLAWEQNNFREITARLAPEFVLITHVPDQGVVQIGREAAVEQVRQFVDAVRGQEALWNFRILTLLPRGGSDVIAVVRSDLTWLGGSGQDEISLEVLRKDDRGHWLLVRKNLERRTRN